MKSVLAMLLSITLSGCAGGSLTPTKLPIPDSAPRTVNMGLHHGLVFLSTKNSKGYFAVIEILDDNTIIGNTYLTAASAEKAVIGYGLNIGTDITGQIRGALAYTDSTTPHANYLVFIFQHMDTGGQWSDADTGHAYFDGTDSKASLIELADDSTKMSGTWVKQ